MSKWGWQATVAFNACMHTPVTTDRCIVIKDSLKLLIMLSLCYPGDWEEGVLAVLHILLKNMQKKTDRDNLLQNLAIVYVVNFPHSLRHGST